MNQPLYNLLEMDFETYPCIRNYHSDVKIIITKIVQKEYGSAKEKIEDVQKSCQLLKEEAKKRNDENTANVSFLLNEYLLLLQSIASFWKLCDSLDYQDAWWPLQDGIDHLRYLQKFMKNETQLIVKEISEYLANIEKLYPYVYFSSIELINKTKICSLCNKSPFDPKCSHIAGNLYMGEIASIMVTNIEMLGVALVKNPMDKRCVIFMNCDKANIEDTPFKIIHTLIKTIKRPFHFFELKLTKRTMPRHFYNGWPQDSPCPCNSQKLFKECCSNKEVIENPHYEIYSKGVLKFDK